MRLISPLWVGGCSASFKAPPKGHVCAATISMFQELSLVLPGIGLLAGWLVGAKTVPCRRASPYCNSESIDNCVHCAILIWYDLVQPILRLGPRSLTFQYTLPGQVHSSEPGSLPNEDAIEEPQQALHGQADRRPQLLHLHFAAIICAAWSQAHRKLITGDASGTIVVWAQGDGDESWKEEMANKR